MEEYQLMFRSYCLLHSVTRELFRVHSTTPPPTRSCSDNKHSIPSFVGSDHNENKKGENS